MAGQLGRIGVVVFVVALVLGAAQAAGAAANTWTLDSAAQPKVPISTQLHAISCFDPSHCLAVGGPIAMRSHIDQWTMLHPAVPSGADSISLQGVSCVGRTDCYVVGSSTAGSTTSSLAEHWDGSSWTIEPTYTSTTSAETVLSAVSCTAGGSCEAVGHYGGNEGSHALIEKRTATGWVDQTIPAGVLSLSGVSCSSASACTAVGDADPLRWDGHAWTVQAGGGYYAAVSCPTDTSCWGVGSQRTSPVQNVLTTAHWDGSGWTQVNSPNPYGGADGEGLAAVSCASDSACTAVGMAEDTSQNQSYSITERWNGHSWKLQTTPPPDPSHTTSDILNGVSCPTGKSCTSVGSTALFGLNTAPQLSLAERWNGSSWTVQNTPNRTGFDPAELTGISCPSGSHCSAVGGEGNEYGWTRPLAERANGSTWFVEDAPTGADPVSSGSILLRSVSCSASSFCLAVGGGISEMRANGSWQSVSIAIPATASGNPPSLDGVSCLPSSDTASSDCTAVGGYNDAHSDDHLLVEKWTGAGWTVVNAPKPPPGDRLFEMSVSCVPSFCMAAGTLLSAQSTPVPFSESWNGSTWSIQSMPNPGTGSFIEGVSCSSASACTAVGRNSDGTVVERWNGSSWAVQPSANAPSGTSALLGVSCPAANFCAAVGYSGVGASQEELAEHWDGSSWTLDSTPATGPDANTLASVSCVSRSLCVAAGNSHNSRPLVERYSATT